MASENAKTEYQYVSFFIPEMPPYCDTSAPAASAERISQELFGFGPDDFNPGHRGRYHGWGKYGHTFEVQVKFLQAQALAGRNHPSVYNIFM